MPIVHSLKERLARYRQIKITVVGRKSGRTISIPVWFVLEGQKLYLLPVRGSDTQWCQNVLKNPRERRQVSVSTRTSEPRRNAPKIGRNEPCPWGSGKKYKRCCGGAAAN